MPSLITQLIGADEAGYGPNLGPLVVSASHWDASNCTAAGREGEGLWDCLSSALSQSATTDGRLHVADSKVVYQPGRGLAPLERSVLALLQAAGQRPRTLVELRAMLSPNSGADAELQAPWYAEIDLDLPVAAAPQAVDEGADRLRRAMDEVGLRLIAVQSDLVTESRFNRLTSAAGSKGAVLTEVTLRLITRLWSGSAREVGVRVFADKHGGRSYYSGVLTELTGGEFVQVLEESPQRSRYRVRGAEFQFEAKGERHLPVAVASMVSKYLRELSMLAVNAFWRRHLPELRPTKGYPMDARRFRAEIAATQQQLGIADAIVWRAR